MGLKKYPKQNDHWSTDPLFVDPKISGIMPRDMFNTLKCAFHADDNNLISSNPFAKIRTIIEHLNKKFKQFYTLDQKISIDETMIAFRGHSGFNYYIPTKPTKIGIKMYALCESLTGYCYAFKFDGGKKNKIPDFINTLVNELLVGLENIGYIVFFDSWFSNPLLLQKLISKKIACTGMISKNRAKFIKKFVTEFSEECKFSCKNNVNCLLWRDKNRKRHTIIIKQFTHPL